MAERNWSEGQLSRRSGVKQPTIHRIIVGDSKEPRRSNLEKIARAFGLSVDDLYDSKSKPAKLTATERGDALADALDQLTAEQRDLLLRLVAEFRRTR